MAKKGGNTIILALTCTVCKNRNYMTKRNKINNPEKMKPTKYCKHCRKATEHKETEKLK